MYVSVINDYVSVVPKYIAVFPVVFSSMVKHLVQYLFPDFPFIFKFALVILVILAPMFILAFILRFFGVKGRDEIEDSSSE